MPVELTQRYDDAVRYARTHHAADLRKGTAIPYLAHLLAVSALTLEMEASEDEAIAALLHDVIEDHGGPAAVLDIRERFGAEVARIVRACSDGGHELPSTGMQACERLGRPHNAHRRPRLQKCRGGRHRSDDTIKAVPHCA